MAYTVCIHSMSIDGNAWLAWLDRNTVDYYNFFLQKKFFNIYQRRNTNKLPKVIPIVLI